MGGGVESFHNKSYSIRRYLDDLKKYGYLNRPVTMIFPRELHRIVL